MRDIFILKLKMLGYKSAIPWSWSIIDWYHICWPIFWVSQRLHEGWPARMPTHLRFSIWGPLASRQLIIGVSGHHIDQYDSSGPRYEWLIYIPVLLCMAFANSHLFLGVSVAVTEEHWEWRHAWDGINCSKRDIDTASRSTFASLAQWTAGGYRHMILS